MNIQDTAPAPPQRIATVIVVSLLPLVIGWVAVCATMIAVAGVTTAGALVRATANGWLVLYQVPLFLRRVPLGFEPLLPTLLVFALTVACARWSARELGGQPREQARRIALAYGLGHGALAAMVAAAAATPMAAADPTRAFLITGVISGLAAVVGVGWRSRGRVWAPDAPPEVRTGLRAGFLATGALLTTGLVAVVIGTLLSLERIGQMLSFAASDIGGQVGQTLLSIGYLPNAVLSGVALLLGPGFTFGTIHVDPLSVTPGRVPPVPLLAAIPESAPGWLIAVLVVPMLLGVGVGWYCGRAHPRGRAGLRAVVVAAATTGLLCLALMSVTGGQLGRGPFNPVSVPVMLTAVAAFAWVCVFGVVAILPSVVLDAMRSRQAGVVAGVDPLAPTVIRVDPVEQHAQAMPPLTTPQTGGSTRFTATDPQVPGQRSAPAVETPAVTPSPGEGGKGAG